MNHTFGYVLCCQSPALFLLAIALVILSLLHIYEPTRQAERSYPVFCMKKKKARSNKADVDERPSKKGKHRRKPNHHKQNKN